MGRLLFFKGDTKYLVLWRNLARPEGFEPPTL